MQCFLTFGQSVPSSVLQIYTVACIPHTLIIALVYAEDKSLMV